MTFTVPLVRSPFCDEAETRRALAAWILKGERLSMGEQCQAFEYEFATAQGCRYTVIFNSGGSANLALLQSLRNLGRLKDRSRVGFSALTWATNVMPILQLGMVPVPIDVDPHTLNVMQHNLANYNPGVKSKVEGAPCIDAFFVTNVLGLAGDLPEIREHCGREGILLLEDNCEALGTTLLRNGERTGNFGLASTCSFYVSHHMSTVEGGVVCTNDEELHEMLVMVRANGWDRNLAPLQQERLRQHSGIDTFRAPYTFFDLAFNFRPTELTGFLGRHQLKHLAASVKARERNWLMLEAVVRKNTDLLTVAHDHIETLSALAFPVLATSPELRSTYLERCRQAGVEVRPIIAGNIQNQPFYRKYVKERCDLPGTDFVDSRGFYFGDYPELIDRFGILANCLSQQG